jgi:hypothetical protein
MTTTTRLAEALDGLDVRLRATVDQLDAEVEAKERELREVREERAEVLRVLRAIDPTEMRGRTTKAVTKRPATRPGYTPSVSQENQDALVDWIRAHEREQESWTAAEIERHADFARLPMSRATINGALLVLSDRGVVRLDRVTKGGGKKYKLTKSSDGQ